MKEFEFTRDLNPLEQYVYDWLIKKSKDYNNDVSGVLADLFRGGCASGFVGEPIYYKDTHAFYDRFYSEIESLREEFEGSTGTTLQPEGDLKNWFAWFAFEATASNLAYEAGADIDY